VPWRTAEALDGTATVGDGAAARCGGVPVSAPRRRQPHGRVQQRDQPGADAWATPPGTPPHRRLRGGAAVGALVGRARWSVGSHHPQRCLVASPDEAEATSRARMASDLTWRTRDRGQGHPRRGRVEVLGPDWQSPAGWRPLTQQPGAEGARRRVLRRRLVAQGLGDPPDHHAQCQRHRPASTVGSLRAHGHVEGLVHVIEPRLSSEAPQEPRLRCTHAVHEVCACRRAKTPMLPRRWGRLEPTPAWKDRADEVMRNIPGVST
jgi:hypothetical protein